MPVNVRLITPITTKGFRRLEDLAAFETPDIRISLAATRTGPGSIESAYESTFSEPGTVARIIEAEREGIDAVVVDCMADPALQAARECVSIPVVGPSQAAMHLAAMLGHTFSVLTVLSRLRVQFENLAAVYGLRGKLASVRAVDIPVLDLETDIAATQRRLVEVAEGTIVEDGAHAVVFGCTGLLGCAEAVRAGLLERGHDIPVIDPIPNALRMAALLVSGGLSHSKTTWPSPPAKPMVGYPDALPVAQAAE
jgi:allantoin racemase